MDRSIQIKAMASGQRLEILRLLARPQQHFGQQWSADPVETGVCMTLIAERLGIAQPTASKHLELLREAGFITVEKRHKWSYCRRDEAALREYLAWVGAQVL